MAAKARRSYFGRLVSCATVAAFLGGMPGARAQALLDTPCPLGARFTIKDYKTLPSTDGRGQNMAAFVRGKDTTGVDRDYMMLVWSRDSGRGDGGISFWSWDQPGTWSAPVRKNRLLAAELREAHTTPLTNMFAKDWRAAILQATTGFSVFNLDWIASLDATRSPRRITTYTIAGAAKGGAGSPAVCPGACASYDAGPFDYESGAVWFIALAAPYIYVAQAANGLNIYKLTDPANASAITWIRRYDASWFGHRVNQIWVRGNFAIASALQENYGATLLDLSNPEQPVKLGQTYTRTGTPAVRNAYSWTLNGSWLYAATKQQGALTTGLPPGFARYRIASDPTSKFKLTTKEEVVGGCSSGGYTAIQDHFAFVGLSTCLQKIDLDLIGTSTDPRRAPTQPPYWQIDVSGADNDFATPFGNAVFLGSDHHTTPGSAIICQSAASDTTAPTVNGRNPAAGETAVSRDSGVGLSFSDNLKPWTINTTNLPIRKQGSTTPVTGYYSYQLNMVNFRPATRFEANTTYEVVVTSGVKDLAGNSATASVVTFRTKS